MTMLAYKLPLGWQLQELLGSQLELSELPEVLIQGINIDSRKTQPGDLFFACQGNVRHGLEYAWYAVRQGVAAIVYEPTRFWSEAKVNGLYGGLPIPFIACPDLHQKIGTIAERFYGSPSRALDVIAITGSKQRTHCLALIAECLRKKAACGIIHLMEPISAHKQLDDLRNRKVDAAVLDIDGSVQQSRYINGISVDIAVFTGIDSTQKYSKDHQESVYQVQRTVFSVKDLGYGVINADDELGFKLLKSLPDHVESVAYGLRDDLALAGYRYVQGCDVSTMDGKLAMTIHSSWGDRRLVSQLAKNDEAASLLAALTVLLVVGISLDCAIAWLGNIETVNSNAQPENRVRNLLNIVHETFEQPENCQKWPQYCL